MLYALLIVAGLLLVALLTLGAVAAQATAGEGERERPRSRWQFYPSPLGLVVLSLVLVLAGLLLWRVFPAFLFLPIVIPFFWWRGFSFRRKGDQPHSPDHTGNSELGSRK